MGDELQVIKEVKLKSLLSQDKKLEASGVTAVGEDFYVVFDNSAKVARINEELNSAELLGKKEKKVGYEAIVYAQDEKVFYLVEESLKHKKHFNARISRMNESFKLTDKRTWLDFGFKNKSKGIEGLAFHKNGEKTYLLALFEGLKKDRGFILLYQKKKKSYKYLKKIYLPKNLNFKDFSDMDLQKNGRLAIVSQESSALWIGELDTNKWEIKSKGQRYDFPKSKKGKTQYCNIEGVSWISQNRLVMVSDAKKKKQGKACLKKEQSIHIVSYTP